VEKAEDCPVDVEGLLDVSSVATLEEGVVPPVDLAARIGRLVGTREDRPGFLLSICGGCHCIYLFLCRM